MAMTTLHFEYKNRPTREIRPALSMVELNQQRYYASEQYLLPADAAETTRLNAQHRIIVKAFGNKLSLAPMNLKSGDRVLESAAGTGIWALEFFEKKRQEGVNIKIECIDISDKQFPGKYPSNIHFSLHSVTDLPAEWSSRFSYAHQRLLITAMNDSLWHKTISELFRVLEPGGWVELVEIEGKDRHFDVGPHSAKLQALVLKMYAAKGCIGDLAVYLPPLLEEAGFLDVRCEARDVTIGRSGECGYRSTEFRDLWQGMKSSVLKGSGFGLVETEQEFEELLQESMHEWDNSNKATSTFYTIVARKP
ncbi:hypothetical protein GYMLUDRAFT_42989 [Collybiopsis luxurians FD-317 M1]|uniref:Methyltransferase domain-containing protein n=1 Tax=Collybiopsis luxurians FD-317 M1 TaxID=944289 RepID=A0A0D0BCH8_9AGAR|nr:hypothetical protein GYMLUDRAFT_42989 [Collybiopsis luxurians FD-317 M1]